MDKYAVVIDPNKVEEEKRAGKGAKKDDNVNVPMDPEKGTEPYEKRPEKE